MKNRNIVYTLLAALLLAIVAFVFFAPADFEGKVLQQPDIQQGLANGQEAKAYEEATGEKVYWTGSLFSGMPTFQISPSYTANKMLQWVTKVYTLWLPSPANILFAMMIGFFIMCLCMKMRWPVALFGAVAWGLSTYFIILIGAGHIWKFLTLAYIPPTIGGIALCYRKKYLAGAALTSLFAALQIGSNHPQMTYYFLYVVGAMMIAWLVSAIMEKRMKVWLIATACVIGAGGLGVCANLASLYMTYEYSKETMRGKSSDLVFEDAPQKDGLDYDYITAWSYGKGETFSLLIPNVKGGANGKPVEGRMKPLSMSATPTLEKEYLQEHEKALADSLPQYFGDQPMTNGPVYVGAFVLVLAILAMFIVDGKLMGPMKWALFGVSILAVILAWGHNFESVTTFFIDNVPFYNKFRTPSSMLVVVEFCLPLLAAMAIIKMADTPDFLQRYGTVFYTVCGVVAFICLIGWIAPSVFGTPWSNAELTWLEQNNAFANPAFSNIIALIEKSRLDMVSADSGRSLIFILLGFAVCYFFLKGNIKGLPVFVCALTVVVLIDLFTVNKRYVDNDNFTTPNPTAEVFNPTEADLQILQDKDPNYRVYDLDGFNTARSSYFHKTLGGYHAAKLTRYEDLINYQIGPHIAQKGQLNPDVINMLNARYFIMNGQVYPNPEAYGNAWFVDSVKYVGSSNDEMEALDHTPLRTQAVADRKFEAVLGKSAPVSEGDYIRETSYAPGILDYEANTAKGGVAVFSEIYFPWGWEATIDGKPAEIGRVDYVLRALKIPAGKHKIHFEFKPKRLEATNTLGIISVSIIYLLCLIALGLLAWRYFAARRS